MKKDLKQIYLKNYSEDLATTTAEILSKEFKNNWNASVVIPCYQEGKRVLTALDSISAASRQTTLTLLVINGKFGEPESSNQISFDEISKNWPLRRLSPQLHAGNLSPLATLLVMDCFSEAFCFSPKQGVGLARKLGCDIALALHAKGKVTQSTLRTTDADAVVAADYFDPIDATATCFLYPFEHIKEPGPTGEALTLYESYMDYYVAGLRFATSPYAFYTIGSTLAFPADAYAAVRGFPKRLAGEDFYLVDKLSKLGPVVELERDPVRIFDRPSLRVPFGTGAAQDKILKTNYYPFPDPEAFISLKEVIDTAKSICEKKLPPEIESFTDTLRGPLQELQMERCLSNLFRQAKTVESRFQFFHTFFDGLRTLRFIKFFPHMESQLALPKAFQLGIL